MLWVLEYLDDIESDMSVFHRVDDIHGMESERFFRFATRLPAYEGVLAARIAQEQETGGGGGGVARASTQRASARHDASDARREVPGTIEALKASNIGQYFEFA